MKILITDKVHPSLISRLKNDGHEVDYRTDITLSEVISILPSYNGIVINSKIKMDSKAIDRNPNLDFIARLGSGMEIVDIHYAHSKNIRIINTPEGNCNAVGEQALGMLLMLSNNLYRGNEEVKSYQWNREKNRGIEIRGKTVGIIGVGHTGSSFAKKLQGWDVTLLGYDKYKKGYEKEFPYIEESTLEHIQDQADIISFHLPLTLETIYFCDNIFLNRCQKRPIIINTSRGVVIKTPDLIQALLSGRIIGACLDVLENEKPKTYTSQEKEMYQQLFSFDQVITSPHVAGWTFESLKKIADLVYERINNGYSIEIPKYANSFFKK